MIEREKAVIRISRWGDVVFFFSDDDVSYEMLSTWVYERNGKFCVFCEEDVRYYYNGTRPTCPDDESLVREAIKTYEEAYGLKIIRMKRLNWSYIKDNWLLDLARKEEK